MSLLIWSNGETNGGIQAKLLDWLMGFKTLVTSSGKEINDMFTFSALTLFNSNFWHTFPAQHIVRTFSFSGSWRMGWAIFEPQENVVWWRHWLLVLVLADYSSGCRGCCLSQSFGLPATVGDCYFFSYYGWSSLLKMWPVMMVLLWYIH